MVNLPYMDLMDIADLVKVTIDMKTIHRLHWAK